MSTIAAIATAPGGGIGIIRVSGDRAVEIGRQVLSPWPKELQSHHLYLGTLRTATGEVVDRVLFCAMLAPRSYTGEDVLEIHGHGGEVNLAQMLATVLAAGADPAGPGEFTRRAFFHGKLDLTQAEAIATLIGARSVKAAREAQRQLEGGLRHKVNDLRRSVVAALSTIEGGLDFPDAEEDLRLEEEVQRALSPVALAVEALARSYAEGGRALGQGIEVALLGRTNAGKSSLLNALCGAERVLVDAAPGTTRDYIEVRSEWDGVQVTLIDTAGERDADTSVEKEGQRLGRERWRRADLLLLVVDGTVGIGKEEKALLAVAPSGVPVLVAWNKVDQQSCLQMQTPEGVLGIPCSALCGYGLQELRRQVLALLAPSCEGEGALVTSARQAATLAGAAQALRRALSGLAAGASLDLVAADVRAGAHFLGEVTGEEVQAAVVDAIFARFCVGK